ncbi:MAG TPA: hypothetical protein VNB92_02210 [Rubrobacter sp.]|nr:hypothetical protein [Rubrobacter sp.]
MPTIAKPRTPCSAAQAHTGSKFGNMASTPKAAVEVTAAPNTKVTTNR